MGLAKITLRCCGKHEALEELCMESEDKKLLCAECSCHDPADCSSEST